MALNDTNCLMMSQQLLKVFLRRKNNVVQVVTVVDVDDEDRVGNSLLQIWMLKFGPKAKLLFRP